MTFEADLKAHLQADATVSGYVNDRITPQIIEEGKPLPAITYAHVFGEPQNSIDGFTSGTTRYVMQINCWALTKQETIDVALAVRNRLGTVASTIPQIVITEFPVIDDYEPDTKRYLRALQVSCWHQE
jgi:hypothetical protein